MNTYHNGKAAKHYLTKKVLPQWKKKSGSYPLWIRGLADFEGEQWKEIPGYDGYLLSSLGRVKSLSRRIELKNGKAVTRAEKILKLNVRQHKEAIIIKDGINESKMIKKASSFSNPICI